MKKYHGLSTSAAWNFKYYLCMQRGADPFSEGEKIIWKALNVVLKENADTKWTGTERNEMGRIG